jgi:phosphoglycolate phosphatase/pyrophosphatase PpaX
MRYRALILDHDDTAVDSTARVHYPSHLRSMAHLRPGHPTVDLDTWFLKNFHPGILGFLRDELGLDARELAREAEIWREGVAGWDPVYFEGFLEALAEFRARGGQLAVASHAHPDLILEHYRQAGLALEPELVFGWDADPDKRKPSPYPVRAILGRLGLAAEEVLVVDDLRPGVEMALAAGVPVAAAGWAHDIPAIRSYMQANCVAYFERVADFADFILG